jgi:signal transduction histidine kinase
MVRYSQLVARFGPALIAVAAVVIGYNLRLLTEPPISSSLVFAGGSILALLWYAVRPIRQPGAHAVAELPPGATAPVLLATILDKMTQGLMVVDAAGIVVVCNTRAIELLGLPPELLASRPSFKAVAQYQSRVGEFAHLPSKLRDFVDRAAVPKIETVYERERPNGTILEIRSVPLAGGGMVRTYTDVTLNRRLAAHLRETQRLESIGKLAGGIAHDFNNLLAVISLNAEILADRLTTEPEARELVGVILTAVASGSGLTHRLLAYSRKQTLRPQLLDLGAYLQTQIELIRRTIGPSITVLTAFEDGLPPVLADASQVGDALLNVAVNARDAMPNGGTLEIRLHQNQSETNEIADAQGGAAGGFVVLSVTDTGCGMTQDVLAHATDPFFTTKPVGDGTGLGLSMVEGFASQSGGRLTIDSTPGVGTTVSIFLPCAEGIAQPSAPVAAMPLRSARHERVLIVDDNAAMRGAVAQILKSLGYAVHEAGSGPEALQQIAHLPPFDLLLTDLAMPDGMSGIELAAHARFRWPALKVLLMTGFTPEDDQPGPGRAAHLLKKPFSRDELAAAVRAAIDTPA